MEEMVYVITGYGGQPDGGLFRIDNVTIKSVLWFETETNAQRYIDLIDPNHTFPFAIVATTPRELIHTYGYKRGAKCDGENIEMSWRIRRDRM